MDPLDVANLTQEGAWQYLVDLGFPVSRCSIKVAFDKREVHPVRLGNRNFVSRRDMLNWIESKRQTKPTRYVGVNTHLNPKIAASR
ncbi:hypothetical protein MSP7336_03360 [Mycobacterium shimoidei]|uniref:Helix-turn-helix domain-containing protein n=1 Tax=Mycobacterium shimoidei TaxID=29313 RepID=A0A375Z1X4_MYCSH|nr:hypothetical protein [Mycobacterium shimoidei]SRX95096.1 hypothetical protein MSP7336_03360 [Mycobacterium shimoidei]